MRGTVSQFPCFLYSIAFCFIYIYIYIFTHEKKKRATYILSNACDVRGLPEILNAKHNRQPSTNDFGGMNNS